MARARKKQGKIKGRLWGTSWEMPLRFKSCRQARPPPGGDIEQRLEEGEGVTGGEQHSRWKEQPVQRPCG